MSGWVGAWVDGWMDEWKYRWMEGPGAGGAHEKGNLRNNKSMFSVRIIWREERKYAVTTNHFTSNWHKVGEHEANLTSLF